VRQLLKLKYITSVFLGPDFISVNKQESGDWTVRCPRPFAELAAIIALRVCLSFRYYVR
jgi:hypothetical protein